MYQNYGKVFQETEIYASRQTQKFTFYFTYTARN